MIFHLNRSVSVFNYSQWRLVCSKSTLGFLTSSIMFLGWLFGNIIFGILSDKYGRRKILFFSSCLVCWVAFVSSFVPWYWMYATLRFIIGFGLGKPKYDKFATLETKRGLEPKCIPQWFLGLLLGPGQSAIGHFFFLVPNNTPRSPCENLLFPVFFSFLKERILKGTFVTAI